MYAVEVLKQLIQKVSETLIGKPSLLRMISHVSSPAVITSFQDTPGTPIGNPSKKPGTLVTHEEDICIRYWMPLLFGLHDVIMTCDLEVRTRALQYLFETLKLHGSTFSTPFWELLAKGVLFPIFDDMKPGNSAVLNSKFANKEDLNVWLSTTLIQALRQFVDLFTHYYKTLGFMLGNMFGLLKICILHENEAMARIGSTCVQQLVEQNVKSFDDLGWSHVSNIFTELFEETAPKFLFFNYNKEGEGNLV